MTENHWKTASIILFIIAVTLSLIYLERFETYKFNDFEISKLQLEEIAEDVGTDFDICDMRTNGCIRVGRIE